MARFLDPNKSISFAKVSSLIKADGSATENEGQKAEELLDTFYPPSPKSILDEPITIPITATEDPDITTEEVKQKKFSAKPWKALGRDDLPAMIWRQV